MYDKPKNGNSPQRTQRKNKTLACVSGHPLGEGACCANHLNFLCSPCPLWFNCFFQDKRRLPPETVERPATALDRYAGVLKDTPGIDARGARRGRAASPGVWLRDYALLDAPLHPHFCRVALLLWVSGRWRKISNACVGCTATLQAKMED